MSGAGWDPEQYQRFSRERAQPFWDLVALVRPRPSMKVMDLGCGPGTLTRELHQCLGGGGIVYGQVELVWYVP